MKIIWYIILSKHIGESKLQCDIEKNHAVIGNLVCTYNVKDTYIDKYDPWMGILAAAAFPIFSTTNILKVYSLVLLLFSRYMILLIKYKADWVLICQKNQAKINRDDIHNNSKR